MPNSITIFSHGWTRKVINVSDDHDKLDKLLRDSLKAAELEVDTPIDELKQLIAERAELNRQMKKEKRRRVIRIAVAVILLLGISGAVIFPTQVYAFKKQFFQTIFNIGKSLHITLDSDAERLAFQNAVTDKINAIQEGVPFKILIPQYVPPGYTLESVKQNPSDTQAKVVITFIENQSAIRLTQAQVADNYSVSVNADSGNAKAERVNVDRFEGNLITYDDGTASLIWITDKNVMCQILGDISSDQALEMASSISY